MVRKSETVVGRQTAGTEVSLGNKSPSLVTTDEMLKVANQRKPCDSNNLKLVTLRGRCDKSRRIVSIAITNRGG